MKNEVLLSFIIPVYNVEPYLVECINSIKNQMTAQCEIILVNDGSTDSSGDICCKYANEDIRIRVIEQKNMGAAAARNTGLHSASGKYVTFVDSDDRISANSVSQIISWINSENCDVCFMQMSKFYSNGLSEDIGEDICREEVRYKNQESVMSYLASRPKYSGSGCGKLYRRDFLVANKLEFPEDGLVGEDLVFVRDVLICAASFDSLDFPYYEYRQSREGSVTNVISYRHFLSLARFVEESSNLFTHNKRAISYVAGCAMSFAAYEYMIMLLHYNFLGVEERIAAIKWLRNFTWVAKYAQNSKGKFVNLFLKMFGIKFTAKMLNLYMSIVNNKT